MNRKLCILFAFMLFVLESISYGLDNENISGFYFKDELKNPLSGALIALYNADNNILIDYTYSMDNGRFTLNATKVKGRFYIVATKDKFSKKTEDFEYDPKTPSKNMFIKYQENKNVLTKIAGYVFDKFDDIIKVLIGLFLGLVQQRCQSRKKAKKDFAREFGTIKVSVNKILINYNALKDRLEAFGKASGQNAVKERQRYIDILSQIENQVKDLTVKLDASNNFIGEVVYEVHKQSGSENYAKLKDSLKGIEDFIKQGDGVLTKLPEDQKKCMRPFEDLKSNSLLKDTQKHESAK